MIISEDKFDDTSFVVSTPLIFSFTVATYDNSDSGVLFKGLATDGFVKSSLSFVESTIFYFP